jgi:predicted PurR-regulated permease PerM
MTAQSSSPSFARRVLIAALIVSLVVIVLLFLGALADVMMLVLAGVMLAVFLDGLTGVVQRRAHLSHGLSLALVCVALLAVFGVFVWLAGPAIGEQASQIGERIPAALSQLRSWLAEYEWAQPMLAKLETPEQVVSSLSPGSEVLGRVTGVFSTAIGALTDVLIISIIGLYLAADPRLYIDNLVKLAPPARRQRIHEVVQQIGRALKLWLIGRVASMAAIGAITGVGLMIAGVPLALVLGVIAGMLSFIPYIGPILSFVPAGLIAMSASPTTLAYALIVVGIAQLLESYLITPLISKRMVSMPPALLIAVQVIMGALLGLLGVLLATPLAVALIVIVQMLYIEDVLGDRVRLIGDRG